MDRMSIFKSKPQDMELWKKLHKKYQQAYLRKRLEAVRLLWSGESRVAVSKQVGCTYDSLSDWIDIK